VTHEPIEIGDGGAPRGSAGGTYERQKRRSGFEVTLQRPIRDTAMRAPILSEGGQQRRQPRWRRCR
jgi:hypothetical protein